MSDYKNARYAYFERQWNHYKAVVEHWLRATTAEYDEFYIREQLKNAKRKMYFYEDALAMLGKVEDE